MKKLLFALLLSSMGMSLCGIQAQTKTGKNFDLPPLPYPTDALAPTISKQALELHWGKHLQTYLNKLNKLIVGTEFENASLETIVKKSTGPIFSNGAQSWNHIFFFNTLSPTPQKQASGKLLDAINRDFGSFQKFKELFSEEANAVFGSGWVWLCKNEKGSLSIVQTMNANNPMVDKLTPLLTFDIWEHAFYLDYQNRRAEYVEKIWDLIDWSVVDKRY